MSHVLLVFFLVVVIYLEIVLLSAGNSKLIMIDLVGLAESSIGQMNSLTITATLGVLVVTLALWTMIRPSRFPPGPRGLPIVGSVFGKP